MLPYWTSLQKGSHLLTKLDVHHVLVWYHFKDIYISLISVEITNDSLDYSKSRLFHCFSRDFSDQNFFQICFHFNINFHHGSTNLLWTLFYFYFVVIITCQNMCIVSNQLLILKWLKAWLHKIINWTFCTKTILRYQHCCERRRVLVRYISTKFYVTFMCDKLSKRLCELTRLILEIIGLMADSCW